MEKIMSPFFEDKTQLVELVVQGVAVTGNTATRFSFTDQPFLRDKEITAVEIFTNNDVTPSPFGNPLQTAAQTKGCYLTLYGDDPDNPTSQGLWLENIPFWDMHNIQNGTDPYRREPFRLIPRVITWEKSFVFISTTGGLANTVNTSFLLRVTYRGRTN